MVIIPVIAQNVLTSKTTFSNYLLIVNAYSKIPKLYGTEIIDTEEVMGALDMFQYIFVKIDLFGWWDLKKNQQMQVHNLPPCSSSTNVKPVVFI